MSGQNCRETSRNGTHSIDLKSKDICSIIKACKDGGVAEFEYGSLRLRFGGGDQTAQDASQHMPQVDELPTSDKLTSPGVVADMQEAVEESLMVSDPVGWESAEIDRQIELMGESNAANAN